jgi:hypothetical protein
MLKNLTHSGDGIQWRKPRHDGLAAGKRGLCVSEDNCRAMATPNAGLLAINTSKRPIKSGGLALNAGFCATFAQQTRFMTGYCPSDGRR